MSFIKLDKYSLKNSENKFFIKDLNLDINRGDVLGIAGNSGVGKTILALEIIGITNSSLKSSGKISRNYKNKKIAILFQNPLSQIFSIKVYDEIKNSLYLNNLDSGKENIEILARNWQIYDILYKKVDKLSLGEAQKVAISSIMISNPDLIILDEPFQYVDNSMFKDNLLNIKKNNPNIVVVIIEHNFYMLNLISNKILYIKENGNHELLKKIEIPDIKNIKMINKFNYSFEYQNLYFSYSKKVIFSNFSYKSIKSFIIIDGKNGAGKSTFVKLLINLINKKKGNIIHRVAKEEIKNPKLKNIKSKIGYIFQNPDYQIFANTVKEEIFYGTKSYNYEYFEYWIDKFKLVTLLNKSPHILSYGERRRVNFLSATINLPNLIIYDEPTVGLDYSNRKALLEFMKFHNDRGVTQILISHDRWFKNHIEGDIERIKL